MKNEPHRKPSHLIEYIINKIDLVDFLQNEIGCEIKWLDQDEVAITVCPIPAHREKKPSFRIYRSDDGYWLYYCFGCRRNGNIIHFCMDYYGYSKGDSILFICDKFEIENSEKMIAESKLISEKMLASKNRANLRHKIECENVAVSNVCRYLLRKDYNKHKEWVYESYKRMNKAMDELDMEPFTEIGYKASIKNREK